MTRCSPAMSFILISHRQRNFADKPVPNTMLKIVASGEREDPPPEAAQPSLPL